jgi:hypothetical protein
VYLASRFTRITLALNFALPVRTMVYPGNFRGRLGGHHGRQAVCLQSLINLNFGYPAIFWVFG